MAFFIFGGARMAKVVGAFYDFRFYEFSQNMKSNCALAPCLF
jgi:hypothetical protein